MPGVLALERMPGFVGGVTLVAGVGLLAAPERAAAALGLAGQETAMRAIGLSDLVLVPGLLRGRPRWPWMVGRAALNLVLVAYLDGVADRAAAPATPRNGARLFAALSVVDGATGLALRRAGR